MKVTILGIGNILMTDDGFGVRVVERVREQYRFPETVTIVDGHILGANLIPLIAASDCLIIVDTIRQGLKPGVISRFDNAAFEMAHPVRCGIHQFGIPDVLILCRSIGVCPKTIVFGVEPVDIETLGRRMTPLVEQKVDEMINHILGELKIMGIRFQQKETDHVSRNSVKSDSHRKRLRHCGSRGRAPKGQYSASGGCMRGRLYYCSRRLRTA